jgi:hypothetical protein
MRRYEAECNKILHLSHIGFKAVLMWLQICYFSIFLRPGMNFDLIDAQHEAAQERGKFCALRLRLHGNGFALHGLVFRVCLSSLLAQQGREMTSRRIMLNCMTFQVECQQRVRRHSVGCAASLPHRERTRLLMWCKIIPSRFSHSKHYFH